MSTIADLQLQVQDLQDLVWRLEEPLLKAAKASELQLAKAELEVRLLELKQEADPIELRKKEADAALAEAKLVLEERNNEAPKQAMKIALGCLVVGLLGSLIRI